MDTIKKLFFTLASVLLISLGINNVAYATELANLNNTDNNAIENNNVDTTNEADTIDDSNAQDVADTTDESNAQDAGNTTDEAIVFYTENLFDSEIYEIYIDEQGQVYYLEKEPVEQEIVDEIIPDEESEKENKEEQKTVKEEKKPSYTEEELRLLACLVYTEAGNQSYNGMLAVANVVLNRVKSEAYYHVNTIKEVIYDKQWAVQFSVTIKSKKTGKSMLDKALEAYDTGKFSGKNPEAEKKAMNKAIKAAKAALSGENNIDNYLCFRMNNSGAKSIKKKYSDYRILGDHIFYRTK